ncbi:MAG: hypothetical protein AB1635_01475 [Acidobacteriota bacterium]
MFGAIKTGFRQGSVAAVAVTLVAAAVGVAAQQAPPGGQRTPAGPSGQRTPGGPPAAEQPAGPQKPYVPLAASTLAARPDAYIGEWVTVTATVDQVLGKTAFTLDQDRTRSTGKDVLVLPRWLHDAVELNAYVTVIGEVVKFDPAALAKRSAEYPYDLPPDVAAKFQGKPVILAKSVINPAMVDLARWIPPPMTPEEEALDKAMKGVGGANGALRKGLQASDAAMVKTQNEILAKAFSDAEAFFKRRGNSDAVKWAQDARGIVATIEKAAAAANWAEVKAGADNLGKMCQTCHAAYRERGEDGTFYLKPKDGSKP